MLNIDAVSCLKDNYIWVISKKGCAIVVDPGEASPVIRFLTHHACRLTAILITHRHKDHIGGIAHLQEWVDSIPIALEIGEQRSQADNAVQRLGDGYIPVFGPSGVAGVSHPLSEGDQLDLLGESCQVMAIPGHTREHLAFLIRDALFCGDTLFGVGCGRVLDGQWTEMYASLERIAALPPHTRLFPAHEYTVANLHFAATVEPSNQAIAHRLIKEIARRRAGQPTLPTTVHEERATNPFLRCTEASVQAAAVQRDPLAIDPPAVFSVLRRWKDHFQDHSVDPLDSLDFKQIGLQ